MRICYQGFAAQNHSWAVVAQNISRGLIELNHTVDIFSTNGNKHYPPDLDKNLIGCGDKNQLISGKIPGKDYDMSFSYTAMKNFSRFLQHSPRNRFGIYCYEFAGKNSLPIGFAKAHQYCDKILAPSHFARQVFLDSGVPEDKLVVIPHGINSKEIDAAVPHPLKTRKTVKILINLGQIHKRKNFPGALEMFGQAFNKNSDVCLVLKIQDRPPKQQFELSFRDVYESFERKFPNHAEVEIVREFIPNIYSLYKSCDITFSPSHAEGFGMVPLEGMACGLLPVASNYSGFLDFMDGSPFLIEGQEFNVPPEYLYYQRKTGTKAFMPDVVDGVKKLRDAVSIVGDGLKWKLSKIEETKRDYDWLEVTKKILALVE